MAYYPDAFLEQLQSRIDLVDLIAAYVELKRSGSNMFGLCPFHNEKSPSFSVSPEKQMYYCFGCGKGGNAFQFAMDYHSYSFTEAVAWLADRAGLPLPAQDQRQQQRQREKKQQRQQADNLLQQVAQCFQQQLSGPAGTEALAYLQQRGLPDEVIHRYQLGFAPAGYGFLQQRFPEATWPELEAAGMLFRNERGFGDRFRQRIMFPIRNDKGELAGFGGRISGDGEPKYLNSPETTFFHKSSLLYGLHEHREHIRHSRQLLVVEGYMDVLALAAHQMPVAVAPLGTAISEQQLRMIFRLCDAPVFCFDGDEAGYKAAWRALERMLPLLKPEWQPRFLYLPQGEDPDSLLQQQGEAGMRRHMEEALSAVDSWLLGLRKLAGEGVEGRARMAAQAASMLSSIQDPFLREAWQDAAALRTGSRQLAVNRQLRPATRDEQMASRRMPKNRLQDRFLAALFQKPERFRELPDDACNFTLDDDELRLLYSRALSLSQFEQTAGEACAAYLQRIFPDDPHIPRWINEHPVSDLEFSSITLDMLRAWLEYAAGATGDMAEKVRIRQRLAHIRQQQRNLTEQLESERRGKHDA